MSRLDRDNYVEHGESWYRAGNGYALTPGHNTKAGERYRIFDPSAAILRCFGCHSTGALTLAADQAIVPAELGVRCEACHGPGVKHSTIKNPARFTATEINELCGSCHRMPASAVDATDLRSPWNARHQPLMLAASVCFRKSDGRLSCLTCHSAHTGATEAQCAKCHEAPRHTKAVAGRSCVECHMPAVRPQANLKFANHRIAIYAPGDPMSPIRGRR